MPAPGTAGDFIRRTSANGAAVGTLTVAQQAGSLRAPWCLPCWPTPTASQLSACSSVARGHSAQLSALTATDAPRGSAGNVLTLVDSIGFAISAPAIDLFVRLAQTVPLAQLLPWLALGPLLGCLAIRGLPAPP